MRVVVPPRRSQGRSRRHWVQVLSEPVHHSALTAVDNPNPGISQGVGERVAFISQRIVVSGDDHDRRQTR
jgi:hypothetical protein